MSTLKTLKTAALLPVLAALAPALHAAGIAGFGTGFVTNADSFAVGLPAISANGSTLLLTDAVRNDPTDPLQANGSEATSAFFQTPQSVANGFDAAFTFQEDTGTDTGPFDPADGFAFVLQNDPRGTAALGDQAEQLGYGTHGVSAAITNSAAVEFNLFPIGTRNEGTNFFTGGQTGADGTLANNYNSTGPVDLTSTDPIRVQLAYDGTILTETLTDLNVPADVYTASYTTDLAAALGADTAFVGFTGADGSGVANQSVRDFTFAPRSTPAAVPEPGTFVLLALGLLPVGLLARRRKA